MKDNLLSQVACNHWANSRLAGVLEKLTEEQIDKDMGSSFPTLRKTVYHLWDSESVWYQRLQLAEQVVRPSGSFSGSFEEACRLWVRQSQLLRDWVEQASPQRLEHTMAYVTSTHEYFKSTVAQVICQLFSHGAYHRGQMVTMLRQAGITKIPSMDYIVFMRSKKY
jgi:uncharacterized damage-inducible protein DinB